jgi:putative tryptophan/tyrosine transport system substrate-binding protein
MQMRRRAFIAGLGLAMTGPSLLRAQQAVRRIGVLMAYAESETQAQARVATFRDGLARFGWIEGQNLVLDVRGSTADLGRISRDAADWSRASPI